MITVKSYIHVNILIAPRIYGWIFVLIFLSISTTEAQWVKVDSCSEGFGESWRTYFIGNEFQRFVFEADSSLNSVKNLPLLPICYRLRRDSSHRSIITYHRSIVAYHPIYPLISLQNIGVYRWNNDNHQWQSVFYVDNIAPMPYDTVTSILVSDSLILIGNIFQGLLRSTDLGNTWYLSNTGLLPISLSKSIIPSIYDIVKSDSVFLIGASNGIYRSTDNALTWQQVINDPKFRLIENAAFASFENVIIVGLSSYPYPPMEMNEKPNTFYRSIDNGKSWNPIVSDIPANGNSVEFLVGEQQKMIAIIDNNNSDGVYYSKDTGETWIMLPDAGQILNKQRLKEYVMNVQILEGKLYAYTKDKYIWCYNLPD